MMMKVTSQKFKDKFRIPSNRLNGWDYSTPGYYFVTICTKDKKPWFGEIIEEQMILSPAGEIIEQEMENTARIRTNACIDPWVIMPNHIPCDYYD